MKAEWPPAPLIPQLKKLGRLKWPLFYNTDTKKINIMTFIFFSVEDSPQWNKWKLVKEKCINAYFFVSWLMMNWSLLKYLGLVLVHILVYVCIMFALLVVIVEGVHGLLVLPVHPAFFTETHSTTKLSHDTNCLHKFGKKHWSISLNCLKTTFVIYKLCTHITSKFPALFTTRKIWSPRMWIQISWAKLENITSSMNISVSVTAERFSWQQLPWSNGTYMFCFVII